MMKKIFAAVVVFIYTIYFIYGYFSSKDWIIFFGYFNMPTSIIMIKICEKIFHIFHFKNKSIMVDIIIAYVSGAIQYGIIGYALGWLFLSNIFENKDAR